MPLTRVSNGGLSSTYISNGIVQVEHHVVYINGTSVTGARTSIHSSAGDSGGVVMYVVNGAPVNVLVGIVLGEDFSFSTNTVISPVLPINNNLGISLY